MEQKFTSLSHADSPVHGLLLAGGAGKRFDPSGRQHKLLARMPDGQALVRVSAQRLLPWVDHLTVVTGPHNTGVARELAGLALRIVVCANAHEGPGATLRHGFVHDDCAGWLIALADMPFIAPSTYQRIRERLAHGLGHRHEKIWRPGFAGQPGHPVAITAGLARRFVATSTDPAKGLASLWQSDPGVLIQQDLDDPGCVRDIDYLQDLPG